MKLIKTLSKTYVLFLAIALAGCGFSGDSNVELVKNGTLSIDESTTIAQAFEGNQFHSDHEWLSFEDPQGRTVVEYRAKLDATSLPNLESYLPYLGITKADLPAIRERNSAYIEAEYYVLVQFTLHKNKESFDASYIGLYTNDEEMSLEIEEMFGELFSEAFEENLESIYADELASEAVIAAYMYIEKNK